MPKVTVIGAGNVGADLARRVIERDLADVTLIDIVEDLPQGKALDLSQARVVEDHKARIMGSNDFADMADSDIVMITAGLARKPGMSRDDLMMKNAEIIGSIIEKAVKFAPQSKIIIVTNPLDVMTYLALKKSGFENNRVVGMAGQLDTVRMTSFLEEATGTPGNKIEALVLGSHGDLMVPVLSHTKISGKPVDQVLPKEKVDAIVQRTKQGGAEVIKLLKTGSAYYAPAASAADMAEAIIKDSGRIIPSCAYLTGQFGLDDVCVGVPVKLGKKGIEEIKEIKLTKEELEALRKSAQSIKENINKLKI